MSLHIVNLLEIDYARGMKKIVFKDFNVSNQDPFVLVAGPCQIESEAHVLKMAERLVKLCDEIDIPLIFKSSFDKANRTSSNAARGIGLDKALEIFSKIKTEFDCPIVTDVHLPEQCAQVADVVDMLQIPAFLCRQTDLLIAAAETGKILNVKKGQFLAPWDMKNVVQKCRDAGNDQVILCERGTCFGYNTLVNDMRGLKTMSEFDVPVMFDATHSVQQPGGLGGARGGQREMVPVLARAAVSIGVSSVFIETHDDPDNALSDGPNMVPLHKMKDLLLDLKAYDALAKSRQMPDVTV